MGGCASRVRARVGAAWQAVTAPADESSSRPMRALRAVDFYGFAPKPRYTIPKQTSAFGALLSLLALALLLFYVISSIIRFQNFNPSKTSALVPIVSGDKVKLGPGSNVDYAVVFRPLPLTAAFVDDRYLTTSMRYVTVRDQDYTPREIQPVASAPCNFTDRHPGLRIGPIGCVALCPVEAVELSGSYSESTFTWLEINMATCDNATRPTPDCAPIDDIWAKLIGGRMNLLWTQNDFGHSNIDLSPFFETTFYLFKRGTWVLSEVFFRKKTVIIQPDYIRRASQHEADTLMFEREKSYVTDPLDHRILTVFLRLDNVVNSEVWSVQSFFDLIGSWSAFFGILAATLGLLAGLHNGALFYRLRPHWDNIVDRHPGQAAHELLPALSPSAAGGGGGVSSAAATYSQQRDDEPRSPSSTAHHGDSGSRTASPSSARGGRMSTGGDETRRRMQRESAPEPEVAMEATSSRRASTPSASASVSVSVPVGGEFH